MPLKRRSNVRIWLLADLPLPEIEVRFAPRTGHSCACNCTANAFVVTLPGGVGKLNGRC